MPLWTVGAGGSQWERKGSQWPRDAERAALCIPQTAPYNLHGARHADCHIYNPMLIFKFSVLS